MLNELLKHLKEELDPEQIQWEKSFEIPDNWTLLPDGRYDVKGNVDLSSKNLSKLPHKFRNVSGNFVCSYNKLTSLEGAPEKVGRDFDCSANKLTSLEGLPKKIGGRVYSRGNPIYNKERIR